MANESVKGINKLLKKLDKLGKGATKAVDQITEGVSTEIALNARQRAPKNLGKLQQSIVSLKSKPLTYQVVVGEDYGPYIEFGTGTKVQVPLEFSQMASKFKGGNGGSFEDGLQSIRDWCRSKGIEESAAYPIFISILEKGINPQPFLYPSFVQGKDQYIKDLKNLLKELTK